MLFRSKARSVLLLDNPFFGVLALSMPVVMTTRVPTMSTDGQHIYVNPTFVQTKSDPELKTIFAHEVLHPALGHHVRRGERDHKVWNEACDYSDNLILKESGFYMPKDCLLDPKYADMSAEAIYNQIYRKGPKDGPGQPQQDKGAGSGGQGQPGDRKSVV